MSIRSRRIKLAILALLGVSAVGTVCSRILVHRADMMKVVAGALSGDSRASYTARVLTITRYNGRSIETRATVYHQGRTEKLLYAGAKGGAVWSLTTDGKCYTYLPRERKLLVSELSRLLPDSRRRTLLAENYRAVKVGTENVAGRDAYVVLLSSRHRGRPSKKLWIDKEHLTVLRSIDYSANGEKRGNMETTSICYGSPFKPGTFGMALDARARTVMVCKSGESTDIFKPLGIAVRLPKYMPAGYAPEGYHLFNSQCNCKHRSAQLTYTDGLNVISVFEAPPMACCTSGGCNMAGSGKGCKIENCDAATTGMVACGNKSVLVVGDLLPEDVRKIAESVR